MGAAVVVVAVVIAAAIAAGWDVAGWLGEVWKSLTSVSLLFLVPALALLTLQTGFSAAAWHGILRFAYPQGDIRYLSVLACYATGVALNSVTPANAGTLVTVLMFVAIIPTATVTGVLAAAAVENHSQSRSSWSCAWRTSTSRRGSAQTRSSGCGRETRPGGTT
jgi:hypothetical protein